MLLRWSVASTMVFLAPATVQAQVPFDVLHAFDDRHDLEPPAASLNQTANGDLYVTSAGGGSLQGTVFNQGTIFKVSPSGTVTMLHVFSGGADGATPFGALIQATDGNFYGTTSRGGATCSASRLRRNPRTISAACAFSRRPAEKPFLPRPGGVPE